MPVLFILNLVPVTPSGAEGYTEDNLVVENPFTSCQDHDDDEVKGEKNDVRKE